MIGLKIRELIDKYPKILHYDYKWKDSENYRDLNEILELLGYKLVEPKWAGEYNDIKGYFDCEIEEI